MHSKTSTAAIIVIIVASLLESQSVDAASHSRCTDDELDEAQKSFRNCVDSAKAGIVTRHGGHTSDNPEYEDAKVEEKVDVAPLCDELDTMLAGCEVEVEALSNCKGRRHVENLKAIHLSSIADVLKALNDDLNITDCDVFKAKEEQEHLDEEDVSETEIHQFPESGPESISRADSIKSFSIFGPILLSLLFIL